MAGDWIKWSKGLASRREVVVLASKLKMDRHEVAGRLMVLWEWCDDNIPDDEIEELSLDASLFIGDNPCAFVDALVGLPGFADALASAEVRWLTARSGGRLVFPHFGRHNGTTAKTRALEARKKQKQRKKEKETSTKVSRKHRDICGTREEKRREESISLSLAAAEASEIPAVHAPTLKTWRIPKGIPPPVAEALDRWQAFRVSVDGRPMPDMQLEASWLEMSRKGWDVRQVEASVEFSIRVGAKNLLDPANDRETRQARAAPPAKKSKYAPVEM